MVNFDSKLALDVLDVTTGSEIWAGLVNSIGLATWANKFRHLNWFQHLGPFVHYGSVWPILVGLAIKTS